jgi:hypothetical protein
MILFRNDQGVRRLQLPAEASIPNPDCVQVLQQGGATPRCHEGICSHSGTFIDTKVPFSHSGTLIATQVPFSHSGTFIVTEVPL